MTKQETQLGLQPPDTIEKQIDYFGKDVPYLMEQNLKLVTIRSNTPENHGFKVGESVIGNCEGTKVPLVVWGVLESIPLGDIDPILLGMDGFLTIEGAVTDLQSYPGYQDTKIDTPMTAIATIHRDRFNELTPEQQIVLIGQKEDIPISQVVRNPIIQEIVKPILAFWVYQKGEQGTAREWLNYYVTLGLLTREQFKEIERYDETYFDYLDNRDRAGYLLDLPKQDFYGMRSSDDEHAPFVLADMTT